MKYLLKHGHLIIDGNNEYMDGAILIDGERIKEVYYQSDKIDESFDDYEVIDLKGSIVMPGSFDTHTHGILGIDFDKASKDEMGKASYLFAKSGTTSFITSLSYDLKPDDYLPRFNLLEDYNAPYCRFEGLHLEGPFLSKKHLGVATPEKLIDPDIKIMEDIINNSKLLKQVTIAYELDGAKQIGKYLHDNNVRVMCGHSDACLKDLDENVDGFTHLFNAMRGLHHRDVTLVNAAFMNLGYNIELIADGNHITRDVLKLCINNIDRNKIMLISDSSTARGLEDGEYVFLSKPCTKKGTVFKTHDNHFAGSVVSINDEMKVLYELGAKYTDLLLYSSLNAFKFYGLDSQFGTLSKGKYADIIIMDDDLNIKKVFVKGEFI